MRQLSKRTQYSLRALYALADNYGGGPMLITQLGWRLHPTKLRWLQ
jgi:hypothetical protein